MSNILADNIGKIRRVNVQRQQFDSDVVLNYATAGNFTRRMLMPKVPLKYLRDVWEEFKDKLRPNEIGADARFKKIFQDILGPEMLGRLGRGEFDIDGEVELPEELKAVAFEWYGAILTNKERRFALTVFKADAFSHECKFVVIVRQDGSHTLATGFGFHKNIAQMFHESVGGGAEDMWVVGGGYMKLYGEKKLASFYDKSRALGPFDHTIVAELASKALIKEGLASQGWKLEVIPSAWKITWEE